MSKNRKLLYCSISDKAKVIKWAEEGAFAWENRSLKATELADPAPGEVYHRFTYVIQGLCWFRGEAKAIADNMVINAVAIKHEENEIVINVKGERYVPESKCIVKIHLPAIFVSSYSEMYFAEKKLDQLVNELEQECFKYIDGCRAQQSLNFEEATEQAEEAKERAE